MIFSEFNKKINVSRETFSLLELYVKLILKWNKSINLISKSTEEQIWQRHILDSAQLINYIDNNNIILYDLGSGAGFPGVVLSILGIKNVCLVESDKRKCSFLYQASKISTNKIEIINERIEKLENLSTDIITARAYSKLSNIMSNCSSFYNFKKILLFKGKTIKEEISEAQKEWHMEYNIYNSIAEDSSYILEIRNLKRI